MGEHAAHGIEGAAEMAHFTKEVVKGNFEAFHLLVDGVEVAERIKEESHTEGHAEEASRGVHATAGHAQAATGDVDATTTTSSNSDTVESKKNGGRAALTRANTKR